MDECDRLCERWLESQGIKPVLPDPGGGFVSTMHGYSFPLEDPPRDVPISWQFLTKLVFRAGWNAARQKAATP